MKGTYKFIYLMALLAFIGVSVGSIFIVFKKYRTENKDNQLITNTKIRYSKIKEKLGGIESEITAHPDSSFIAEFQSINLDKSYLDSMLSFDKLSESSLSLIRIKIHDLASKSNQLEQKISLDTVYREN